MDSGWRGGKNEENARNLLCSSAKSSAQLSPTKTTRASHSLFSPLNSNSRLMRRKIPLSAESAARESFMIYDVGASLAFLCLHSPVGESNFSPSSDALKLRAVINFNGSASSFVPEMHRRIRTCAMIRSASTPSG
jgi:hypothetical protein